jgi:hypothetical protein
MIDARRDEVFTATYKLNAQRLMPNAQRLTPNAERLTLNTESPAVNGQRSTVNDNPSTVNRQLSTIVPPKAMILDKTSFESELLIDPIIFFGSGAEKWKKMIDSPNALFLPQPYLIQAFAKLSQADFDSSFWADPVYTEPVYLKEFFSY